MEKPEQIIDEVRAAIAQWPSIAKACGVREDSITRIQSTFLRKKAK